MKITGNYDFSLEAKQLLESLELVVTNETVVLNGPHYDGLAEISTKRGNDFYMAVDYLWYLGIMAWPYVDYHGNTVNPDQPDADVNVAHSDFANMFGREPTEAENSVMTRAIADAVAASPKVREWSKAIDFDALHALDFAPNFGAEINLSEMYEFITRPDPPSQALRKFMVEHPVLARLAWHSKNSLLPKTSKSAEKAYDRILKRICEIGFRPDWDCFVPVGPVPLGVLRRFQVRNDLCGINLDDDDMAFGLNIARRLQPDAIPEDHQGLLALIEIGRHIAALEGPLGEDLWGYSTGCGLKFTDEEIQAMVAEFAKNHFSSVPKRLIDDRIPLMMYEYGKAKTRYEEVVSRSVVPGVSGNLTTGRIARP